MAARFIHNFRNAMCRDGRAGEFGIIRPKSGASGRLMVGECRADKILRFNEQAAGALKIR
jgi:hypothetical protein